jgi:hypothetical protein
MQSIGWYYQRLASMSPSEILWRLHALGRASWDSIRVASGITPGGADVIRGMPCPRGASRLCPVGIGELQNDAGSLGVRWLRDTTTRADAIASHLLDIFDIQNADLGREINWLRDHNTGRESGLRLIQSIDYRDVDAVGDCKLVWEPNRHHQFVVLARAYRATGDRRYAETLKSQLVSWIDANPFGRGMNWRSPLELGIRAINWIWSLDMISEADVIRDAEWHKIATALYQHCWDITRKFSAGSSANNHLIGEAAGVFVVSSYFSSMPNAGQWCDESAGILEREIIAQTFSDGCTREHAFGYSLFVAQILLAAKLTADRTGRRFSATFQRRLAQMIEFASTVAGAGSLPKLGDCDDGYVLSLGEAVDDVDAWRAVGALACGSETLQSARSTETQTAYWLFGRNALRRPDSPHVPVPQPLTSRAFDESGYYLLQCGDASVGDDISVLFDCAELGFGSISAHGHADALSIVLRAFGHDILVDSGTYDYFSYPQWRTYFRSTAAHNTVRIDGRDQSEMLGPFLWGKRARSKPVAWHDDGRYTEVVGEHDGYTAFADSVVHRRTVRLDKAQGVVAITDELRGSGTHQVELFLHFADGWLVERATEPCRYTLRLGHCTVELEADRQLEGEIHRPGGDSELVWISNGYHRKTASCALRLHATLECPVSVRTVFRLHEHDPARPRRLEEQEYGGPAQSEHR